jgi:hypothetical protein
LTDAAAGQASTPDPITRAADRLRDSAKWLIATFGAVGAVVFAGVSISNINKIDAHHDAIRLYVAIVAAAVAIVGVTLALARAVYLAGASTTSLKDLTRPLKIWDGALKDARAEVLAEPAARFWGTLERFKTAYDDSWRTYLSEVNAIAVDTHPKPDTAGIARAYDALSTLESVATRLLNTASILRLQRSFQRSRWLLTMYLAVAALGAVTFAWASNPRESTAIKLLHPPARAVLTLDGATQAVVAAQNGRTCSADHLEVFVLQPATSAGKVEVATVPQPACPSIALEAGAAALRPVSQKP